MSYKLLYEQFRDFDSLLSALNSRKNNISWYGTSSYKEACDMLGSGYLAVLNKMKTNLEIQKKLNSKFLTTVDRPIPHNSVVGYIPNVPAALQNLPNSMVSIDKKPMKRKTLHLMYVVGGNAGRDQDYFTNAGIAVLSAIDIIEKCGIQTKIDLCFFSGRSNDQICMPGICIKNYGERFSIQKVSFPLVHTSMFRRLGFKWIETTTLDIDHGYSYAYGSAASAYEIEQAVSSIKEPNTYVLSTAWVNDNDCSVESILKKLEMI